MHSLYLLSWHALAAAACQLLTGGPITRLLVGWVENPTNSNPEVWALKAPYEVCVHVHYSNAQ